MGVDRWPRIRWSLYPLALIVLGVGVVTVIVTVGIVVTAVTAVGVSFIEGIDEAQVENTMSTGKPAVVLSSPRLILAQPFDDAQTTFDFLQAFLISSPMECESYRLE